MPSLKLIKKITVLEDSNAALQLEFEPKHRPQTKDTCVKYHHFRRCVKNKTISIHSIDTDDQQSDFMKSLAKDKFEKIRQLIMGW